MALRKRDWIWLALMALVVIWGGQIFTHLDATAQDVYRSIGRTADDRYEVESAILRYYVEKVNPEKLQLAEIDGMINELDTYSDFLNRREQEDLRMTTQGSFGGLGIEIYSVDHYPTVISTLDGTPAAEIGMQSGDQIVEIEGKSTRDEKLNKIVDKLRGVPGTPVNITVHRPGVSDTIPMHVVRAEIPVKSVSFSGLVWDPSASGELLSDTPDWVKAGARIGYIRLTQFNRGAADEVENALDELRTQNVQGIILDERTNPGGLLEEARGVADLFLPKGELIVSTKGRDPDSEQKYYSERDPVIPPSMPLVVLVDGMSASAAEIVAGAIQDNDRGLIIGQQTFGKGSVQTLYTAQDAPRFHLSLSPKAELKLTTAYYYSPSGRCIHRPRWHDGTRGAVMREAVGDTGTVYHTLHGRDVRGGGGISPDVKVAPEIPSLLFAQYLGRRFFFRFASDYVVKHPDIKPATFKMTDRIVDEFRSFVNDTSRAFKYEPQGEQQLDELEKAVKKADYGPEITDQIDALRKELAAQQTHDFDRSLPFIEGRLRSAIAGRAWTRQARVRAEFNMDNALKVAIEYLNDHRKYREQIAISPPVPHITANPEDHSMDSGE